MRKWMRERLQRRKKSPAGSSDQPAPAPAPLQPAYFDAEQSSGAEPESSREAESPVEAQPEPQPESKPASKSRVTHSALSSDETPFAAPSSEEGAARRSASSAGSPGRSRRRRGGRGRGGRGREQAVAQAFAPAAVKGSIPSPPAEGTEDEAAEHEGAEDEAPDAVAADAEAEAPAPEPIAAGAPKAPAIPAAPQRPPKGVVVLAIGLPGSGKSSWFKRHNLVPLSSDMVRSLLFDDVREQRFQDLVFSNLRSMLKARLIAKRPMNYVDATNLTPQERQHWIKLAKDYQYEVHAVFFDVPLEVCVERHQRRDRVVPEDVMRRMAAKLKPPAFEEGFAKITVVRVKKKDDTPSA
jgi:predicted kinase